MRSKLMVAGATIAGVLASVIPMAHAQYSTSTAVTDVSGVISDVGSTYSVIIPIILGILAGLLALGWGVRKFRQHVSGRKF